MESYIETDLYRLWIDDGILYAKYNEPLVVDLKASKQVLKDRNKLSGGKAYPLLGDARVIKYWTKEAKKHHATEEYSEFIKAAALVVNSSVRATFFNFYIKFYPERYPLKVFYDFDSAVNWLKQFRD